MQLWCSRNFLSSPLPRNDLLAPLIASKPLWQIIITNAVAFHQELIVPDDLAGIFGTKEFKHLKDDPFAIKRIIKWTICIGWRCRGNKISWLILLIYILCQQCAIFAKLDLGNTRSTGSATCCLNFVRFSLESLANHACSSIAKSSRYRNR